jgi:tetratricopeptide (TPR) repeat protein
MDETSPQAYFVKGKEFLRDGKITNSCKSFYKAYSADQSKPEYISYYGVTAALSRGEIKLGLELCTRAIKMEFYRPEFYVNLAKVYDASGNKKGAITALSKGAKYDTKGEEIHNMLVELGVRKRPIIPFLKRANPLNKMLGIFVRVTMPRIFRKKGPRD